MINRLCFLILVVVPLAHAETTESAAASSAASSKSATEAKPADPKVASANIQLHTTVTGNQEQPRVLYILPWQTSDATKVEFSPLDNEQKAVFKPLERDELQRELDAADTP